MTDQCEHDCDHIDFNWDLVYRCRACGEIVPDDMAEIKDAEAMLNSYEARGQRIADQANEIQELQELFVYFFGENYQELTED